MNRLTGLYIFFLPHRGARNETPHIMKAIILSCQSLWEKEKAGNPKLIGRMRGAKKVGDWVRSSLLQLLTDSWEYEMRLRSEKYSYFLCKVLNSGKVKENLWCFQFWQFIDSDKILNWSENTDYPYHCQEIIYEEDVLLKRCKFTFFKWMFQSLFFIKSSVYQHSLTLPAPLNQSSSAGSTKMAKHDSNELFCRQSLQTKSLHVLDCRTLICCTHPSPVWQKVFDGYAVLSCLEIYLS